MKKKLGQANSKIFKLENATTKQNKTKDTVCAKQASKSVVRSAESEIVCGDVCSICASPTDLCCPRYFMGSRINSTCRQCDDVDLEDPFSSFPTDGLPPSLASHWIAVTPVVTRAPSTSFKTHCVDQLQQEISFNDKKSLFLEEEMSKWADMIQKNLDDMLARVDELLSKMETRLDKL